MKFERPQKGNPHRLTVDQHVFPKRSLERYAGADGRIAVRRLAVSKDLRLRCDDPIFCARRAWDHGSEVGFMKACEDRFQAVARRICAGGDALTSEESYAVSVFSALWRARFSRRLGGQADLELKGVLPGTQRTVDEEEQMERAGMTFVRGLSIPARFQTGLAISYELSKMARALRDVGWGVQRAERGELLLPDTFGERAAIPISPTICLYAGKEDTRLSLDDARALNRIALETAIDYVAARDFSSCPI